MAKINEEFVKFMTTYVDVLNDLRLSIIELNNNVLTATSGGKTIPTLVDELMTAGEAESVIAAAGVADGSFAIFVSDTDTAGLAPGILVPTGGVVGTRKLTLEELAHGGTAANAFKITAAGGAVNLTTGAPRDVFGWVESGVSDCLIAYEDGRYHAYPNDGETPLTDIKVSSVSTIAIGVSVYYPSTNVPYGFIVENGQSLLKAEYPELYAAIGDAFGESGTTFNVPNKSGLFCLGAQTVGRTNTSVVRASYHEHAPSTTPVTVRTSDDYRISTTPTGSGTLTVWTYSSPVARNFMATAPIPAGGNTTLRLSNTENRPKNITIVSCIKAKN